MAFGAADFSEVPGTEENVLGVMDLPSLDGNSSTVVPIDSHTAPFLVAAEGFAGRGWTVLANLRENTAGTWASPESPSHPAVVLQTLPRLDENTNLPNGGIPIPDGPATDSTFNPATIQSLLIQGRSRVSGPSNAGYQARAIFNTANRACMPQWSLDNASGTATISDDGVLHVGALASARKVMVRAKFFGQEAVLPVTLFPLPPQVLVRASIPSATEEGSSGEFRITRTGSTGQPLTVSYAMEGTASNGVDYSLLNGSLTIPADQVFSTLPGLTASRRGTGRPGDRDPSSSSGSPRLTGSGSPHRADYPERC